MKQIILVAALFTAFGIAYIERAPAELTAEQKVAPSRWCGRATFMKTRCYWDYKPEVKTEEPQVANYRWGGVCRHTCNRPQAV